MKKIIIAGGSGFLGENLAQHFINNGYKVIILTRSNTKVDEGIYYFQWDAKSLGKWVLELENSAFIINLTGKSVDCRYNEINKNEILASRIDSTKIIGKAIQQCKNPPKLWINSSTATIYRDSLDKAMTEENGEIGCDFSMTVAKKWEEAFFTSTTPNTRKVALRISLVLGKNGGVLPMLKTLTKLGLGGKHGSGKQKFAWIHIEDLCRIVDFIISNDQLEGVFNCSAPEAINNQKFMSHLRTALKISFGIPTPKFLLQIGTFLLRTEPELILKSRYVYPKKLEDAGFRFKYTNCENALLNLK